MGLTKLGTRRSGSLPWWPSSSSCLGRAMSPEVVPGLKGEKVSRYVRSYNESPKCKGYGFFLCSIPSVAI
jgi:hypothetical protein